MNGRRVSRPVFYYWDHVCDQCCRVHVPDPCCQGCGCGVTEKPPHDCEDHVECPACGEQSCHGGCEC